MTQIGQTLKLLRIAAQLRQDTLAAQLGVTANYLSLVENGHREPSLTFLKRFALQLNVPLREFLWVALAEDSVNDPPDCPVCTERLLHQLFQGPEHTEGASPYADESTN